MPPSVPPERVAVLARCVYLSRNLLGRFRVEAAHGGCVDGLEVAGPGPRSVFWNRGRPDAYYVRHDFDADLRQQRLGEGADSGSSRGLPGTRSLEHVAGVVEAVLE